MRQIVRCAALAAVMICVASVARAARVAVEYGLEASLRVIPQKEMKEGVPGKITVAFIQDVSVGDFKECTDYAAAPVFPPVAGLRIDGEPVLKTSKDEIKNKNGKHTMTVYYRMFVYPVVAERGGEFTVEGVTFDFHGKTLTADPVTFTVEAAPVPEAEQPTPDMRRNWLKAPVRKMVDGPVPTEFNPDGTENLNYVRSATRDDNGRLVRAEFGMVDVEYTYGDYGLLVMEQTFNKQGHMELQKVYTYYDNILEPATETNTKWFDGDYEPAAEFVTRYMQYKWDDRGNWIERVAEVQDYDSLDDFTKNDILHNTPAWRETRSFEY